MPQLNSEKLVRHGIIQIVATCQLLPVNPYPIANLENLESSLPQPTSRAFTPFAVDITGICHGRNLSMGEFSGYICWYQPNYNSSKSRTTMEDVALTHEDTQLYDFTASVMRDNGQIQRQWCSPGDYFALLTGYQINPEFHCMGIGTLLFDNLHLLIQQECCIPVRTVFIPPPNADEKLAEALMNLWRRLGYKEIGRTGRTHQIDGYFARCSQKKEEFS